MIDPKAYSYETALKVANDANPEAAAWMRYMADRLADREREMCRFYFADGSFEEMESPEAVKKKRIEAAARLADLDGGDWDWDAEIHKAIKTVLSKKDQGRVMGEIRKMLARAPRSQKGMQ